MNIKLAKITASGVTLALVLGLCLAPQLAFAQRQSDGDRQNRGGQWSGGNRAPSQAIQPSTTAEAPSFTPSAAPARAPRSTTRSDSPRPQRSADAAPRTRDNNPRGEAPRSDYNRPAFGQGQNQPQRSPRPDFQRPDNQRPDSQRPDNMTRPDRNNGSSPSTTNNRWDNGNRPGQQGNGTRPYRPDNAGRPDTSGASRPNWDRNDRDRNDRYDNRAGQQRHWTRGQIYRPQRYDYRNDSRFHGYSGIRMGFYFAPSYGYYRVPTQWYGHRWTSGEYLPDYFYTYRIYDYEQYDVPIPPYGCAYYFVGRDIVLVDLSTGQIIDSFYDIY